MVDQELAGLERLIQGWRQEFPDTGAKVPDRGAGRLEAGVSVWWLAHALPTQNLKQQKYVSIVWHIH